MNIFLKICLCNLWFGMWSLLEENASGSRERKSNIYEITIICKRYAQIFLNKIFIIEIT